MEIVIWFGDAFRECCRSRNATQKKSSQNSILQNTSRVVFRCQIDKKSRSCYERIFISQMWSEFIIFPLTFYECLFQFFCLVILFFVLENSLFVLSNSFFFHQRFIFKRANKKEECTFGNKLSCFSRILRSREMWHNNLEKKRGKGKKKRNLLALLSLVTIGNYRRKPFSTVWSPKKQEKKPTEESSFKSLPNDAAKLPKWKIRCASKNLLLNFSVSRISHLQLQFLLMKHINFLKAEQNGKKVHNNKLDKCLGKEKEIWTFPMKS